MKNLLLIAAAPALTVGLVACSSFQSLDAGRTEPSPTTLAKQNTSTSADLLRTFKRYEGAPYRFGGSDRNGFDCSGFINVVFDETYALNLPRTTEQLADGGRAIRRDQLRSGDIIIFKTSVKQLHAGIYTDNGQFIHASTSKGVIQSSLDNAYWQQRYLGARRYL